MILLTRDQQAEIERFLSQELDLGEELLMENAGLAAALHIVRKMRRPKRVGVVIGPGHNGADGCVMARHLNAQGIEVLLFRSPAPLKHLTQKQLGRALKINVPLVDSLEDERWNSIDWFVDALFGTGLLKNIPKDLMPWIGKLNKHAPSQRVISLDLPSGLDADTGHALPECVRADLTLPFIRPKLGFYFLEGPEAVGRVKTVPLSVTEEVLEELSLDFRLWSSASTAKILPQKPFHTHKALGGHVGVAGGWNAQTPGAALLAARGASRLGAGYVTLLNLPDLGEREPQFLRASWKEFSLHNTWIVGPGWQERDLPVDSRQGLPLLRRLIEGGVSRVVVDAGALDNLGQLSSVPESWVITPHEGEMARLLGKSSEWVKENRLEAVNRAYEKWPCVVVLKGPHTLVKSRDACVVIASGNSSLAKAGTGDVLAGFIGGLMAQGLPSAMAAATACELHGSLADDWIASGKDVLSLTPEDLLAEVPFVAHRRRKVEGHRL